MNNGQDQRNIWPRPNKQQPDLLDKLQQVINYMHVNDLTSLTSLSIKYAHIHVWSPTVIRESYLLYCTDHRNVFPVEKMQIRNYFVKIVDLLAV